LAIACAERVPKAIETLEREHLTWGLRILAKGRVFATSTPDEIRQRIRERLFVGVRSRSAEYLGRGTRCGARLHVVRLRARATSRASNAYCRSQQRVGESEEAKVVVHPIPSSA
jgi:hypothetical protein